MKPSTPPPTTPPPLLGLLTPPSTAGCGERKSFAQPQRALNGKRCRRNNQVQEVEKLTAYNEDTDIQADGSSKLSPTPSYGSSAAPESDCSTEITRTSPQIPLSDRNTLYHDDDIINETPRNVISTAVVQSFSFLRLPLSVRSKIYEYLFVVPAIICVRQNHSVFHDDRKAYLYPERREFLPGIAYALTQTKVNGPKSRFSRFPDTNFNMLRVSKEVFIEARAVMYGLNTFDIVNPSRELVPPPDFSVPLFPPGYQRLVTKLTIRIRTFYSLDWLVTCGYTEVKRYYRGLDTLTLILELDCASKGLGRQLGRMTNEKWVSYIQRLQNSLGEEVFGVGTAKVQKTPIWLNLRVLFSGETYKDQSSSSDDTESIASDDGMAAGCNKREELRCALIETWELFKRGGRKQRMSPRSM